MQVPRSIATVSMLGLLVAACGGSPAATEGPGGGGAVTAGPKATSVTPQATQTGGGGGGAKPPGWDANGKVRFEVSGPVTASDELGFLRAASVFGGTKQTYLSFTVEGNETFVVVIAAGTVAATYTNAKFTASGTTCTSTNLKVEASSASGSIDCTNVAIVQSTGTTTLNGHLSATFDAH